ncbi:hypothetical protein GGR54DRAFT_641821 [Hypoxylon sp. NC1633]|nr:hypothetical protein GGR54DRAFT_641821 [Hypoxylon sp. NC1633]
MPRSRESPEVPEASSPGQQPGGRESRVRRLGMTEDERRARQQRRARFQGRFSSGDDRRRAKQNNRGPGTFGPDVPQATVEQEMNAAEPETTETENIQQRKPWESLVIGDLGENLSYIERKEREIEQQRYILNHHAQHAPHQVPHDRVLLEKLIMERAEMEDNIENNMPEDQREERNRVGQRLDALAWALNTCQCEAERINIQAAIQGYQSGEITYSNHFTLIYGGHIVDVCPTYRSFCEDRQERLDSYYARFGPGWLWQEPPLLGQGSGELAMKGVGLPRLPGGAYQIGHYTVVMEFCANNYEVMRGSGYSQAKETSPEGQRQPPANLFVMLLDCGATMPSLTKLDVERLEILPDKYPAQGVITINSVTSARPRRFYELYVSVCSDRGESLVSEGDQAVWPGERRTLGGLYPVWIDEDKTRNVSIVDRLSGMVPFDSCYMSSAPTMRQFWLGEDRRDVLGAKRLPAHLRFDTSKHLKLNYPREFKRLQERMKTPDQVIFVHTLDNKSQLTLTDTDWLGTRGKSEQALVERRFDEESQRVTARTKHSITLEPRRGEYREGYRDATGWRLDFGKSFENEKQKQKQREKAYVGAEE